MAALLGWAQHLWALPGAASAQPGHIQAAHQAQGPPDCPHPSHTGVRLSCSQTRVFDLQTPFLLHGLVLLAPTSRTSQKRPPKLKPNLSVGR